MRYFYFGHDKKISKHQGIICFGYDNYSYDGIPSTIHYSIALCSPKDQFSKKRARLIISGRRRKGFWRYIQCKNPIVKNQEIIGYMLVDLKHIANNNILGMKELGLKNGMPSWADKVLEA